MRSVLGIVAVVLTSMLLLEVLVRASGIADHLYTDPAFVPSPDGASWRYRAGFQGTLLGPTSVRIGTLGSRVTADEDDAAGHPRIAVFGDSITFGQAVASESTFCTRLERRLRRRWPHARVLNFGVQGHSLTMEVDHVADRLAAAEPDVVVLAFDSDDLNPERAQSYVDTFGYLTKKAFGSSSSVGDRLRAALRRSRSVLALKNAYLRWGAGHAGHASAVDESPPDLEARLEVFRRTIRRFDSLTHGRARLVMCLDLADSPLVRALRDVMSSEFPQIAYVQARPIRDPDLLQTLRVPRDGHPNARAHALYAHLLERPVRRALAAVETAMGGRGGEQHGAVPAAEHRPPGV